MLWCTKEAAWWKQAQINNKEVQVPKSQSQLVLGLGNITCRHCYVSHRYPGSGKERHNFILWPVELEQASLSSGKFLNVIQMLL